MFMKNIACLSLLLISTCIYSSPLAAHLMINRKKQCTGKVAKQREPLFIQAEEYEENFIKTKSKCLKLDNCDSDKAYQEAKKTILLSIVSLNNHLTELERKTDGACHMCEKNETKDIKKRLMELLETN